jgi:hypothetical protein
MQFEIRQFGILIKPNTPTLQSGLRSRSYFGGVGYSNTPDECSTIFLINCKLKLHHPD